MDSDDELSTTTEVLLSSSPSELTYIEQNINMTQPDLNVITLSPINKPSQSSEAGLTKPTAPSITSISPTSSAIDEADVARN